MRLERRRDASFSDESSLRRAVAGKDGLVAELLTFCQSSADFEDLQKLLAATLPTRNQPELGELGNDKTRNGYVYLLRSGKKYKIGYAIAPLSRAMVISNMTPDGADLLHEIRTDDPRGIEAYWHNRFADKRGNGEWFALTAADVAAFKRRKFM